MTDHPSPLPHRYTASVPVFHHYAGRLLALLDRVEAAGDSDLLEARLTPDMFPFHKQVEVAANFMARTAFPLTGRPAPAHGDFPATVDGLRARIADALARIDTLDPQAFRHDAPIPERAGEAQLLLAPDEFLFQYALPNFFFHTSAAYQLLRHHGLPLGKAVFDGYHVYTQ